MLHQPSEVFRPSSVTPPVASDAALIALGVELEAAAAIVTRLDASASASDAEDIWNDLEAACAAESAIIAKVESLSAMTIPGLRVKAFAVWRCHGSEVIDDKFFHLLDGRPSTDIRLAAGILRDLLALPAGECAP